MDSIIGIELKQILEAEFNIFLAPEDLRTMTFAKLYRLKEEKEKMSNSGIIKVKKIIQLTIKSISKLNLCAFKELVNHKRSIISS